MMGSDSKTAAVVSQPMFLGSEGIKMTDQVFTIPEPTYHELAEAYGGICLSCGEFQWEGVEPDAEGYKCESCGAMQVTGIEQALIAGRIEFGEE
jgi:hypothetical protein